MIKKKNQLTKTQSATLSDLFIKLSFISSSVVSSSDLGTSYFSAVVFPTKLFLKQRKINFYTKIEFNFDYLPYIIFSTGILHPMWIVYN